MELGLLIKGRGREVEDPKVKERAMAFLSKVVTISQAISCDARTLNKKRNRKN